ncbi:MAG: hypothetical protein WA896_13815, partial [Spirulinaceae cyanobacterium]
MNTPTSKPALNPLLKAALSSLDINLEEELIRYRRLSKGSKPGESQSNFHRGNTLASPPTATETLDLSSLEEISDLDSVSTTTEINLTTQLQEDSSQEDATANLVHQPTESEEKQNLAEPTNNQQPPEDYLESSEQLLRSLEEKKSEEKQPQQKKNPAWKQILFSPLGIASVAVFVVASTLLGATLLDPQTASKLGLGGLLGYGDGDVEVEPIDQAAIEAEQAKASPSGPNLANNEEFTKELDLDTLSTVESGATPDATAATSETPAAIPSPTLPPNP